jgi:transcriptional regulator
MAEEGLEALLHALIEKHEARTPGEPWRAREASADMWAKLLRGIVGFELEVLAWRPTIKLSQNKSSEERATIAAGLEGAGSPALAQLMRTLVP